MRRFSPRNIKQRNNLAMLCLFAIPVESNAAFKNVGVKALEQAFAVSTVMTDSEALTFGFANVELNFSNAEKSIDLKKNIDIFSLPYQWQLPNITDDWTQTINVRAAYIEVQRDSEPLRGYTNFKHEQIVGGFIQYAQRFQLDQHWYAGWGIGSHLSYYNNKYNYSADFPDDIREALDGHIFNTSAVAFMVEPVVNIGYQKMQTWGQWKVHNTSHYLIGQGIGGPAKSIADVAPEGWRVSNGIEFKFSVPQIWGVSDHIALDFKRIDIGGDMSGLSEHGYYYETTIGWLIDTKNSVPLLDNVGIGFNINYGSSITGGSLVLYYNE